MVPNFLSRNTSIFILVMASYIIFFLKDLWHTIILLIGGIIFRLQFAGMNWKSLYLRGDVNNMGTKNSH